MHAKNRASAPFMSKAILSTLQAGAGYLAKHGVDEARLNMEHLLAHVLDCRRLDLYLRFGESLGEPDLAKLRELTRRRAEGTPLQHLLGTVPFGDLEIITDHRALIPRPETEYLCEKLVQRLTPKPPARILDMACGSGCIGLFLAHAWAKMDSEVLLADISEDALDLARLNASRLMLANTRLIRSDLFEKINGTFDLLVSNLPYIPSAEIPTLSREVRRDPILALDGGPDGLDIVRRLITSAPTFLNPNALMALELGMDQPQTVAELLESANWQDIEIWPDLAGINRFVLAKNPTSTQ
jgi:release factor glutamine methyltransferase